ncbi:hypothetical protein [Hydrogenophaga sp.]|uniref:hypothetical protein n=1 Tax=Hydrogenophaga sp. TaxID=1904254 RepID=UPI003F6EDAAB
MRSARCERQGTLGLAGFWLTMLNRADPHSSADHAFTDSEIQALGGLQPDKDSGVAGVKAGLTRSLTSSSRYALPEILSVIERRQCPNESPHAG